MVFVGIWYSLTNFENSSTVCTFQYLLPLKIKGMQQRKRSKRYEVESAKSLDSCLSGIFISSQLAVLVMMVIIG